MEKNEKMSYVWCHKCGTVYKLKECYECCFKMNCDGDFLDAISYQSARKVFGDSTWPAFPKSEGIVLLSKS